MTTEALTTIKSLTKAEARQIISQKYEPEVLLLGLQVLKKYYQEKGKPALATYETEAVQNALNDHLLIIESEEIRVVPGAFNSTPAFTDIFKAAALPLSPVVPVNLEKAFKRACEHLRNIRSELAAVQVAKSQGWFDTGFGDYVHRFVQREMSDATYGTNDEHHFFYLWHPDTYWWSRGFEARQKQELLGPSFGGYHHDLATICTRMRADRKALISETKYGETAIFHLVIPAHSPIVIDWPILFADELLPLVVTGARYCATPLVWFDLRQGRGDLTLRNIGLLHPTPCPDVVLDSKRSTSYLETVGPWISLAIYIAVSFAVPEPWSLALDFIGIIFIMPRLLPPSGTTGYDPNQFNEMLGSPLFL